MSQLHCYVKDELAKRFQEKAALAHLSVSKYLATLVEREVKNQWPGGYFELFGNWRGDPLERSVADDYGSFGVGVRCQSKSGSFGVGVRCQSKSAGSFGVGVRCQSKSVL